MAIFTRPHATFFLDPHLAAPIEALRQQWDSTMAGQIAAHVTVIYPEELDDPATLLPSVLGAAAATAPFHVTLGPAFYDSSPDQGIFFHVRDPTGGVAMFRSHALGGGDGVSFALHVTIVHPRTSNLGPSAWAAIEGTPPVTDAFLLNEVAITAFDSIRWVTTSRHPLRG